MTTPELPVRTFDSNDPAELARLRILDAAANRASEGLRVVEDFVRFSLDDAFLTTELTAALAFIGTGDRLRTRETLADVGVAVKAAGEFDRPDLTAVVAASFERLKQALRSLEEYCKVCDADAARRLETLRYRTYTLERVVDITRQSITRLADARLYVLIDGCASESEFGNLAAALVKSGVSLLQLREKSLGDRELSARARLLRQITRGSDTLFIMNDRPDLAVLADADGVHVGQEELSVKDARTIVGPRRLIGVSTHNIEQARQAVLDGADYIGVGPTFPGTTKQFNQFPGVDLVRAVSSEIRLPAYPIGGITLLNVREVLRAGATRVCVSASVCKAADPSAAAADFLSLLSAISD
jgi:thiamine-phosphate pyrophosphorylase